MHAYQNSKSRGCHLQWHLTPAACKTWKTRWMKTFLRRRLFIRKDRQSMTCKKHNSTSHFCSLRVTQERLPKIANDANRIESRIQCIVQLKGQRPLGDSPKINKPQITILGFPRNVYFSLEAKKASLSWLTYTLSVTVVLLTSWVPVLSPHARCCKGSEKKDQVFASRP